MPEPITWLNVIKSVPILMKEIYGDLAKPGVTQVGKALDTILEIPNTLLIPIKMINSKGGIYIASHCDFQIICPFFSRDPFGLS